MFAVGFQVAVPPVMKWSPPMVLDFEKIVSLRTQAIVAVLQPVPLKLEPGPRETLSRKPSALLPSDTIAVLRRCHDVLKASVTVLLGAKPMFARRPPVLLLPTRRTPASFSRLPEMA